MKWTGECPVHRTFTSPPIAIGSRTTPPPFGNYLNSIYSADTKHEVLGIREVEPEVMTHTSRGCSKSHRIVTLHNVLYCPKAAFNAVGSQFCLIHMCSCELSSLEQADEKVDMIVM